MKTPKTSDLSSDICVCTMTTSEHIPLSRMRFLERTRPIVQGLSNLDLEIHNSLSSLNIQPEKLRGRKIAIPWVAAASPVYSRLLVRLVTGSAKRGAHEQRAPILREIEGCGIARDSIGAEICSSMETVSLGSTCIPILSRPKPPSRRRPAPWRTRPRPAQPGPPAVGGGSGRDLKQRISPQTNAYPHGNALNRSPISIWKNRKSRIINAPTTGIYLRGTDSLLPPSRKEAPSVPKDSLHAVRLL
jgi:hypothetical protein